MCWGFHKTMPGGGIGESLAVLCELSTWEAEVEELQVPGLPRLYTQ